MSTVEIVVINCCILEIKIRIPLFHLLLDDVLILHHFVNIFPYLLIAAFSLFRLL